VQRQQCGVRFTEKVYAGATSVVPQLCRTFRYLSTLCVGAATVIHSNLRTALPCGSDACDAARCDGQVGQTMHIMVGDEVAVSDIVDRFK
jgi:hypothetical protein